MDYTWRFDVVLQYLPFLLKGLWVTVAVTVVALIMGSISGLIAALLRLSQHRIPQLVGRVYVDFFRSTPPMVQLIWIYYCLPIVTGLDIPAFLAGAIGLSLSTSAYLAEIFRGGILSLAKGQREAALAIGMTSGQAMRRIILPQAVRRMIPPFTNTAVSTLKGSSLVGIVAVADLMWQANYLVAYTFRPLETLTIVAVIYFVLTYPQTIISNRIYERVRVN
jgi:His/Glu/Gln/Arg/opine family amino acid ABC transporter permease subunit